jgi:hypothetical protein
MLADRLPEGEREELIREWMGLLDQLDEARSEGAAQLILFDFRQKVEARLATARAGVAIEELER